MYSYPFAKVSVSKRWAVSIVLQDHHVLIAASAMEATCNMDYLTTWRKEDTISSSFHIGP